MLIDHLRNIDTNYKKLLEKTPFDNIYGLARSVLALGTFLTLLFNNSDTLFLTSSQMSLVGISSLVKYSLFNLMASHIEIAKIIALLILFLVIIGLYPRITGLLHWYISFSFFAGCSVIDGGDQANAVLTFLLIPMTLLDSRQWHWQSSNDSIGGNNLIKNALGWGNILLLRMQVCIIYLHAAVAKLSVPEWLNGTAVYYWFTHHYHGAPNWIKPLILLIVSNKFGVTAITWGTILLELLLFAAILLPAESLWRKSLLWSGILFHLVILIVHGLISFYFTMASALLLYLSNYKTSYQFVKIKSLKLWKRLSLSSI